MKFDRAFIPLGCSWSSPFARWQGPLAEMPALDPACETPGHLSACWLPHQSAEREQVRRKVMQAEPAGSTGAGA